MIGMYYAQKEMVFYVENELKIGFFVDLLYIGFSIYMEHLF